MHNPEVNEVEEDEGGGGEVLVGAAEEILEVVPEVVESQRWVAKSISQSGF